MFQTRRPVFPCGCRQSLECIASPRQIMIITVLWSPMSTKPFAFDPLYYNVKIVQHLLSVERTPILEGKINAYDKIMIDN